MPLSNAERRRRYYRRWKEKHLQWAKDNPEKAEEYKRRHHLRNTYGISLEDYDSMLTEQGGVCAICGKQETHAQHKYLSVDHCHETGKVRGLLCHGCNATIGYAKDDPARLERAIVYLKERN